jgi:hypothetical protein
MCKNNTEPAPAFGELDKFVSRTEDFSKNTEV